MWFISYDDCRDFEEESQMREIELAPRRFPTLFFQYDCPFLLTLVFSNSLKKHRQTSSFKVKFH